MNLTFEAAVCSHVGGRKNNEDSYALSLPLGLFVVCDGMGGHAGGEVASRIAVENVAAFVEERDPEGTWPFKFDPSKSRGENVMFAAVEVAHRAIENVRARDPVLADMGTTFAALLARPEGLTVAHVGDSRVYRLRDGVLEQLTRDHSMQAEMAAAGLDFPHRNYITRALGVPQHRPDLKSVDAQAGDTFLICSDGLYEVVPDSELAALLAGPVMPQRLIDAALAHHAHDNVTALVLRVA